MLSRCVLSFDISNFNLICPEITESLTSTLSALARFVGDAALLLSRSVDDTSFCFASEACVALPNGAAADLAAPDWAGLAAAILLGVRS